MEASKLNQSQLAEKENQNAVKDAIRITHALNKHLLKNCPHCHKLFEEAFTYEN